MPKLEKLIQRTCAFCGQQYLAAMSTSKYHSAACREKMWRWRKRLPRHFDRAHSEILNIEEYLGYPDSRVLAVRKLKELQKLLTDIDDQHQIRRVK